MCEEKELLLSPSPTYHPLPSSLFLLHSHPFLPAPLLQANPKFRGERCMPRGPAKTPNTFNLRPLESNSYSSFCGNLLLHAKTLLPPINNPTSICVILNRHSNIVTN